MSEQKEKKMECKNCGEQIIQNGNIGWLHCEKSCNLILSVQKESITGCTNPEPEEKELKEK